MIALPRRSALALAAAVVFYAVGAAGHLIPAFLPLMLAVTPWFLLASGVGMTAVFWADRAPARLALWFLPVFLVTFALEALGVATGRIFGGYHYTPVLGTLVLGVPPVIGWNWVLVVLGFHSAAQALGPRVPEVLRIVGVGLACVAFDLLLEPVAVGLGYWVWDGGAVPFQNYVAWGLIAAVGSWWAGRFSRWPPDPVLGWYALLQAGFFAVLGFSGVRA